MDQTALTAHIRSLVRPGKRLIVAVAGAPASGKSTLADQIAQALGAIATIVPMDGFHLDNGILAQLGLLARKGAPETFDAAGFTALIKRFKTEDHVIIPVFDRTQDLAISGAQEVRPDHQVIIVEGNYLLLDQSPWDQLAPFWDLTIWLDVPLDVLEQRLIARWLSYDHTPDEARARALGNDIPNARHTVTASREAQIVIANNRG